MVSTIERFYFIQDSQLGPSGVLYREVPLYTGQPAGSQLEQAYEPREERLITTSRLTQGGMNSPAYVMHVIHCSKINKTFWSQ